MTDEEKKLIQARNQSSTALPGSRLLEKALTELSPEQRDALSGQAANEALRLQSKQAEIAIRDTQSRQETFDHIHAFQQLDKKGLKSHKMVSEMETGVGKRTITSTSGARCFVVTAAYGDPSADMVEFFRTYRDEVLCRYRSGRGFIRWYYEHGPACARWLDQHPRCKPAARAALGALRIPCQWHRRRYLRRYPQRQCSRW